MRAAWLHHAFTQIHPFEDGNGRVARALASLELIRGGLPPLTVYREMQSRYYDSLLEADLGRPQALVECMGEDERIEFKTASRTRCEQFNAGQFS